MKKQFNLVQQVKTYFAESTTDYYLDMRHELNESEYLAHFIELGQQLKIIDNLTSISDLVRKLDKEELVTPCAIIGEDNILDDTLEDIIHRYFK